MSRTESSGAAQDACSSLGPGSGAPGSGVCPLSIVTTCLDFATSILKQTDSGQERGRTGEGRQERGDRRGETHCQQIGPVRQGTERNLGFHKACHMQSCSNSVLLHCTV